MEEQKCSGGNSNITIGDIPGLQDALDAKISNGSGGVVVSNRIITQSTLLLLSDSGGTIVVNNTGTITISFPNTLPLGFFTSLVLLTTNQVNFFSDATIVNKDTEAQTNVQYGRILIEKIADGVFAISGDTASIGV